MNALFAFFKSKDGLVVIATLILLGVVSQYGAPYNPWINLLARVGNILVFGYILWRLAGKSLVKAIAGHREGVAEELRQLDLRKREAEARLTSLEARISGLAAEQEAILEDSRTQARALRDKLIAEAEEDAKRIREQSLRAAENEAKAARDALRSQVADEVVLAVEMAVKVRLAAFPVESRAVGRSEGKSEGKGGKGGKHSVVPEAADDLAAGHAKLIDNALKRVVLQ